jgi:biopolymer transport protein ExbD
MKVDRKARVTDEIPASSMSDIAFLLLVFFLVTTAFSTEKGMQLQLPEVESLEAQVSSQNMLKLEVRANGKVYVGYGRERSPMPVPAIAPFVRGEIEKNPDLICSVKTDDNALYEMMIDVLDELKKASASKIHFVPPTD